MQEMWLRLCSNIHHSVEVMAIIAWGILCGSMAGLAVYHLIIKNFI